jgi:hypothetical protein
MRQPSINPPSFYDDVAPPPLLTPPPNYDDLTPRIEVRDSYFDMDGSESNSDESPGDDSIELPEPSAPHGEAHLDADVEDESSDIEEEDIVDMLGLEDLSLGLRTGSPVGRRSSNDLHRLGVGIWAS